MTLNANYHCAAADYNSIFYPLKAEKQVLVAPPFSLHRDTSVQRMDCDHTDRSLLELCFHCALWVICFSWDFITSET